MKLHMRANDTNAVHTRFTVFVNGANAGTLCMTVEEANTFHQIVAAGCVPRFDNFVSSGDWGNPIRNPNRD